MDGVATAAVVCPNAGCGVMFASSWLHRDVLGSGTELHGRRYRLDYALGRGGFGVTYRAVHTALGQAVAVKEFFPAEGARRIGGAVAFSPGEADGYARWLERLSREGRVLAGLNHPNVVRVQDFFAENGTAYLVMELLDGCNLRAELRAAGGQLPDGRVRMVLEALVGALGACHVAGVFHLDIKPENILVTAAGRIVLVDFGSARQADGRTTRGTMTPDYAPLELWTGEKPGPHSDLYELGALALELLSGTLPPRAPARLGPEAAWVPPRLGEYWDDLLRAALAVLPADRPAQLSDWWSIAPAREQVPVSPTPRAPEFVVHADGRGAYPTLVSALAAAPAGATIRLLAGTHRLSKGVTIAHSIVLVGAGMNTTTLVADRGAGVLHVAPGPVDTVILRDLGLRWEGMSDGDVLSASAGQLVVERCYAIGARGEEGTNASGMKLSGRVQAAVRDCQTYNNECCGILVRDQAVATLVNNVCRENWESGIAYIGDAEGIARGNTCEDNENCGVFVGDRAAPIVENNVCRLNGSIGIAYFDDSGGTARGNTCESNRLNGVHVRDRAAPIVEDNVCSANNVGIDYNSDAGGTARGNTCERNTQYGVYVRGRAAPIVENNVCRENDAGIVYFGDAGGTARGNTCDGNAGFGVYVGDHAAPILENNVFRANDAGIAYWDDAGGTARGNICESNRSNGVHVRDRAAPIVENNVCRVNKSTGISYHDDAGGIARGNTCEDNEQYGMYLARNVTPVVENNSFVGNKGGAVRDERRAV